MGRDRPKTPAHVWRRRSRRRGVLTGSRGSTTHHRLRPCVAGSGTRQPHTRIFGRPLREEGQASLELLAGIPALVLAGFVALQLLATGYSLTLADGAAEAGAMALAAGKPAGPAVRDALPGWARGRSDVDVDGGRLTVRLQPPSPLSGVAHELAVSSSTWVRRPDG